LEYGSDKPWHDPPREAGSVSLETHLHFAAVIDAFNDPIISKDLTGRILGWNQAAARVFGYKEEEILGQSILQLVPPNLHHEEYELLRKLKADETIDPMKQNCCGKIAETCRFL
jgi:PAS domain S-box-containing protein